jgi:hypothetical protein
MISAWEAAVVYEVEPWLISARYRRNWRTRLRWRAAMAGKRIQAKLR